jgi:FkbM family methyltransferase
MFTTEERVFKGHPYKIVCDRSNPGYQHPSWFSFDDEADVRERIWDIQPNDAVFDIGAAYGSYTLTALAAGARAVWAWTPQGPPGEVTEAGMLERSIKANGWGERAVLYREGLFDRSGWLNVVTQEFYEDEPMPHADIVRVRSFDDYGFGSCDDADKMAFYSWQREGGIWFKLDVEGAELKVLTGANNFIQSYHPKITVENHNFKRATIEQEVRDLLVGQHGYTEISTVPYHAVSHSLYVYQP